jgi:thiosulfate/3-mercaptopyruvate sulfurtransferase
MKKTKKTVIGIFACIVFLYCNPIFPARAQEPWTMNQLMPPSELANVINSTSAHKPFVFSIGVMAVIKGSVDIGPVIQKANLDKLRNELNKLPKNADIVIYCGCCPFANCPNIRPAFKLLNEMKFTNHKLLDLKTNIKVDWMNKNYPVN